ncbi:hypothetical protein GCM10027034_27020 [Ramlibacter solisilvae]|uniref:Candidate membrane protein n=1 Tax=Ramlibacter tataouinensis TaxID=94132 RepID=A0A127JWF5_9BURK|nr:hypothetical protein [Ramlibacter tataouinensis]AMO22362.1 hypothetical protein UC35_04930 [Ramlibacter tataouinensis]
MKKTWMRTTLLLSGLAASGAWAHDGHGMPTASHWHATDVLGLILVLGMAAVAIWLSGRGK